MRGWCARRRCGGSIVAMEKAKEEKTNRICGYWLVKTFSGAHDIHESRHIFFENKIRSYCFYRKN